MKKNTICAIICAGTSVLGAHAGDDGLRNPQDALEARLQRLAVFWANPASNVVKEASAVVASLEGLGKVERMKALSRYLDFVLALKLENGDYRADASTAKADMAGIAANALECSVDFDETLLKWKFRLRSHEAMRSEAAEHSKVPDPFRDGTFQKAVASLPKPDGDKALPGSKYMEDFRKKDRAAFNALVKRYKKRRRHGLYAKGLMDRLRYDEESYFTGCNCLLRADYIGKIPHAQGRALVKEAESVLGHEIKWHPLLEELDVEGAVARMERDAKEDFLHHMWEFPGVADRVCSVKDDGKREALLVRVAKSLFHPSPDYWHHGRASAAFYKRDVIEKVVKSFAGARRDFLKWSFRVDLLAAFRKELLYYANAWNPDLPTNGVSAVEAEMTDAWRKDMHKAIYGEQQTDGTYVFNSRDKTRWLYGQQLRLLIAEYEARHFDDEGGGLEADLSKMSPEDRAETMKKVEAVLGRKPKWCSDETGNGK